MLNEFEEPRVSVHKEGLLALRENLNHAIKNLENIKEVESTWICDGIDTTTEVLFESKRIVDGYLKIRR